MIKYLHTNIIARDWKKLAEFYITVFGCKLLLPQRNLSGQWIEKGTGVDSVHIVGAHLKLPGYDQNGPTIEIFQYNKTHFAGDKRINQPGFAHIAFQVDDVELMLQKVIEHGGGQLADVVQHKVEGVGLLTFVYAHDPEGNFIELQKYKIHSTKRH